MSSTKALLLNSQRVALITKRFALQIIENHKDLSNLAIIGLQPRGIALARCVRNEVVKLIGHDLKFGELDHTFFRDDIGRGEIHIPKPSKIDFSTEGTNIIIIDDVLFTGRSVRAAIDAILRFGRPSRIELMVLVERIFERELPIKPDYKGISIDSRKISQKVKVDWQSDENVNVWLLNQE
ncbi:MAG: bifunctional pyr operon transcriptional regulator/uracil phosphoribosyltransferase PyrR [Bacteroidia bacterium]